MNHSPHLRLLVSWLLLVLVCFLTASQLGPRLLLDQQAQDQTDQYYRGISALSDDYAEDIADGRKSLRHLYDVLKTVASGEQADIFLLDEAGNLRLSSAEPFSRNRSTPLSGFDYAKFGPSYYEISRFFGVYSSDHLNVLVPVTFEMNTVGYIAVCKPFSLLEAACARQMNVLYLITGITLALAGCLLLFLSLRIRRPLDRIRAGVRDIASGRLETRIDVRSGGEMAPLAESINFMAAELQKGSDSQKHFLSNVSHDFRSPLTSIRGYTEAMRDGTIPPGLYDRYLRIISDETDRLMKLTSSILDLNTMDEGRMALHLSDFDINRLLRQSAEAFEGVCRRKRISIELRMDEPQLPVRADEPRIAEVLFNLLDNAVKFSPKGSAIRLKTAVRHGRCYVSVKDEGCGIRSEDLPRVWDRFYKTDASRGMDKTGIGLGLPIVKEILNAHGQKISIVSTVHVGTEVVFTLDLA